MSRKSGLRWKGKLEDLKGINIPPAVRYVESGEYIKFVMYGEPEETHPILNDIAKQLKDRDELPV